MRHKKQLLLIPLTIWSGLEQGFFGADFTAVSTHSTVLRGGVLIGLELNVICTLTDHYNYKLDGSLILDIIN